MIRHDLHPPEEVRWIVRTLESAGYRAWAVGGAVRDALRKRAGGDWDLTTSARPRDVQRLFRRTAPIGISHGTVGVIARSGRMYEVTTFRRDVETDGRHARVVFSDDLDEDLARRDFTINAVAWHPLTGEVRDPYGGMADLDAGILRTVGDPAARFAEDRLRVLRALRFAGSFDLRIADDTWRAIVASSDQLGHLSAERIREELWKVLGGQRTPSRTLDLYARSGVLRALYPELDRCRETPFDHGEGTLWDHLVQAAEQASPSRPHVRLAALLHAVALPQGASGPHERAGRSAAIARTLLQRLRASNADVDRITHLVAHHAPLPSADASDADLRRWLRRIGPAFRPDLFRLVIAICRAHPTDAQGARRILTLYRRTCRILREDPRPAFSVGDLAISGADLKALGLRPGPQYGRLLNELLERVTDEPSLNTREGLLRVASELLQDSTST